MPSNFTKNYNLSQWERTDRVLMDDFNADNAKIDGALGEHAAELASHAAQLAKCGNTTFYHTSYQGAGRAGASYPNSVSLPFVPGVVIVVSHEDLAVLPYGVTKCRNVYGNSSVLLTISWRGTTVSWYSSNSSQPYHQMNDASITYHVFAFAGK